ncbi:MAG: HYR domain-containing protein [Saprospirales bacterium]|nr:MAG: HYR domain-containing protein [Saprospirales bacterium]
MMANLLRITCGRTIALTAVLFWVANSVTPAHAQTTWNVCDTCTITTIQAAIDSAMVGDTVLVGAGTYSETIDINKDGLVVRSELGAPATIISGSGSGPSLATVRITANNIVLDGFTINNMDAAGGCVSGGNNASDIQIINNLFVQSDFGVRGDFYGRFGNNILIADNEFQTNRGVAQTEMWTGLSITGNLFTGNGSTVNAIGLGADTEVTAIEDNTFNQINGLVVRDSIQAAAVVNNTFNNGGFAGLYVRNLTGTDILDAVNAANTFSPEAVKAIAFGDEYLVASFSDYAPVVNLNSQTGYLVIQEAIDGANDGDVIEVGANKSFIFVSSNSDPDAPITVNREGITLTTDPINPATLQDDGPSFYPIIEIFANGVTIENFNLVRNNATSGGQVLASRKSDVIIQNNTISGNNNASPAITVDHGIPGNYDDIVTGIEIINNSIVGEFGWGFGIRSENGPGEIQIVNIEDNHVDVTGGGMFLFFTGIHPDNGLENATITIEGNTFLNHTLQIFDNSDALNDLPAVIANNTFDRAVIITDGTNVVERNSARRVYSFIQSAINDAETADTIQVSSGTYSENIDFTGTSQLVVLGPNAGTSGCDTLRNPEAVIQGTITISTGAALDFLHFDGFRIESDSVDGIIGLRLQDGGIYNNVLMGNWVGGSINDINGIMTGAATPSAVQNWTISGNKISGYFRGLDLRGDASLNNAFVVENCFENNSIASFSNNSFHAGTPNIQFERNTIVNNSRGVRFASGHFEFRENALTNNGLFGIRLGTDSPLENVLIENNFINQHDLAIRSDNNSVPTTNVIIRNNDLSNNDVALDTEIDYIANCNWFGTDDLDSITNNLVTGMGTVYLEPYLIDGTDGQPGQIGFFPDPANCQNPDIVFNLTQNSSFSSIQTAIDLANPGDTIQVGTATFMESIVIDKEGLTLQNGSWPVIDGGGSSTPVRITANNVTLKGFKVTNAAADSALIWIDNVTGVTVDSNYLTNPGDVCLYGIAIDGGGEHTVIQNTIDTVAYGIALQNSSDNNLGVTDFGNEIFTHEYSPDPTVIPTGILLFGSNQNSISDNEVNSVRYGIHLADNSDDNAIAFNRVEGQDHGIIFRVFNFPMSASYSAQNNQILANEIIATDSSFKYGIKLQDSANMNIITENNIHSGWGGIWIEGSSDISIVNNFVTTTEYGIRLRTGAENVNVNENSIEGQSENGLENISGNLTDATCNWWGSASLMDINDAISGSDVDSVPYLYSGLDDDPVSPGFQPEPMACVFQLDCPQDTALIGSSAPACNTMVGGLIATSNDPDAILSNDFQPSGMGNASDTYPFGVTVVTFTAESALGDSLSCTTTVSIEEEVELSCVATDTIYLDAMCEAVLSDYTDSIFAEIINGCDSVYILTQNISAGTPLTAAGFIQIEVVAENATYGNSDTCYIEVAVLDSIPPSIFCNLVLGLTVSLNDSCESTIPTFDAPAFYTLTPNCDTLITFSQTPVQGTVISGVGMTPVVLSVSDQSGNSSSCSFNFNTADLIPPTVTCPSSSDTVYVDQMCEASVPNYISLTTVMDNCSPPMVSQDPAPQGLIGLGIHTVRIDIEDEGGNTDSCLVEVTVLDTISPMVSCTSTVVIALDSICQAEVPDFRTTGDVSFSDNCVADSNLIYSQSPAAGDFFSGVGMDSVLIIVSDSSGNSTSCQLYIDLVDFSAPQLSCLDSSITVALDSNCQYIVQDFSFNASVADNCDTAVVLSQFPLIGDTLTGPGPITITLTATDASMNSSVCSFTLEVEDQDPPVIACPASQDTVYLDSVCEATVPDYVTALSVGDNCGLDTVFQNPAAGSSVGIGNHVIIIEAVDESGNGSSCTVNLVVLDTIPPVVSCDPDTLYLGPTCEVSLPDYLSLASATDNCDTLFTTSQSPDMGTIIDSAGVYNVLLSFTDQSGNTGTCTAEVTVIDTIAPTIDCPSSITLVLDFNCQATLGDYTGAAIIDDNCGGPLNVTQNPAAGFTLIGVGSQTVFLEVEDGSGNTANCSFSVITTDTLPPSLTCPIAMDTIYVDSACEALIPDYVSMVSASDTCGLASLTQDSVAGELIGLGIHTVTITAEDNSGNVSTCAIELMVLDTIPPMVFCQNDTIQLDANCEVSMPDYLSGAMVSDNCDTTFSQVQTPAVGSPISAPGTVAVTIEFTDSSGNTGSCDFDVIVIDTIAPSLTCPATITLDLGSNCSTTLADYTGAAIVNDACDSVFVMTQSPPNGTIIFGSGTQTVTITAEDASGNIGSCSFSVVTQDITPPVVSCPSGPDTLYVDASCEVLMPDYATGSASDNCGIASVTQSIPVGDVIGTGAFSITLFASDINGNVDSCEFLLEVVDSIAPVVACSDVTIYLDSDCMVALPDFSDDIVVTDNCDSSFMIDQSPLPGTIIDSVGSLSVWIMATDSSGNSDECEIIVTTIDTIGPSITCMGALTLYLDEDCQAILPPLAPSDFTVNCDISPDISQNPAAGTIFNGPSSISVILTIEDVFGNSDDCSIDIVVQDTTAPVVACLVAVDTVYVDSSCEAFVPDFVSDTMFVQASDNCGISSITQTPVPGSTFAPGLVQVMVLVEDNSGNLSECEIELAVLDSIAPQINCPEGPFELVLDDNDCTAELMDITSMYSFSVSDNCDTSLSILQIPEAGTIVTAPGSITVTVRATDNSGNESECMVDVNVVDEVAPFIICPVSITMPIFGDCESFIPLLTHTPFIFDNCDTAFTVTQTPAGFSPVMGGDPEVVTITVADMSGNTATCDVTVFFEDNDPPVIACPASSDTISVNGDCLAAVPDYVSGLMVTDNCGIESIEQFPESGIFVGVGNSTVIIVATDVNGNSASCTIDLSVEDVDAPIVSDCSDITIYLDHNCSVELPDLSDQVGSLSDNCTENQDLDLTQSPAEGHLITAPGVLTVNLTFTDESGNTGDCDIEVTALDTIVPSLVCTTGITLYLDTNEEAELPNLESLVDAMDNCDADPGVSQNPAPGTVYTQAGMELVEMTATDASGNSQSCFISVMVVDTLCPGLSCSISSDVISVASNNCEISVPDYTLFASASVDCGPVAFSQSIVAGTLIGPGVYPITVTAEDTLSNSSTCSIILTVEDNTPPVVECPASSVTIYLDENCEVNLPDYAAQSSASDNCGPGGLLVSQTPVAGTLYTGTQTINVVVSASDISGNEGSCTIQVSIEDNTAPTLVCPEVVEILVDEDCEFEVPDISTLATIGDNCDNDPGTSQSPAVGITMSGTENVTVDFEVTDAAGNSNSCSVTLIVNDEIAPVMSNCPPDFSFTISSDSCIGLVEVDELVAFDNCTSVDITNDFNDGGPNASGSYPLGTTEVTFVVSDENGNSSTCLLVVEISDNTPPVVTSCPADVTVNCGQPTDPYYTGGLASGVNICNGDVAVTYFDEVVGEYCEDRVITRTFILTDDLGNADSSCVQMVTVSNDAGPVMVNCPESVNVILAPDSCEVSIDFPESIEAYNSCYHESFEFSGYTPGSYPGVQSLSFNRNQSDLVRIRGFFFTPFPNPGTMSPYSATHGNYHGIIKSADVNADSTGTFSRLGGYSSTFAGGFETSIDVYIELNDPAVINGTYGWDVGVGVNDQSGDLLRNYYFHVASNATGQVLIGSSNQTDGTRKTDLASGNHAQISSSRWLRFVWTFQDAGDGSMEANLTVMRLNGTVVYSESYNEASDVIADIVGGNRSMDFPFLEVEDLSIDNVRLKYFPVSTSCDFAGIQTLGIGVHEIECVAVDACDNEVTCNYTVTVISEDELSLSCPSEIEVAAGEGDCFAFVNLEAELSVPCDLEVSVENSFNNGGLNASGNYLIGTTEVEFTVISEVGDTVICITTVEVTGEEPEAISIMCPMGANVSNDSGECFAQVNLDSAVVMTGCDVEETLSIVNDFNSGGADASAVYPVGVTVITYTVTDGISNFASCSISVQVNDTEAPVANCSDISLELDGSGSVEISSSQIEAMFSDNCGIQSVVAVPSTFDCDNIGNNVIVLTATDDSGNTASCSINVTVNDLIAPLVSCPSELNIEAEEGECFTEVSLVASATDNCEIVSVENTYNSGGLSASGQYEIGTTVVTFTAEDASGNSASCSTVVNVTGDAPGSFTLNCPGNITVDNDEGECSSELNIPEVTFTEGCGFAGSVTIENDYNSDGANVLDVFPVGTTTVVFTGDDSSGNTAQCSVNITVEDTESPVANCEQINIELDSTNSAVLVESDFDFMFEDNCGIDSFHLSRSEFDCDTLGFKNVIITAVDGSGNSVMCTTLVVVSPGESDCEPVTFEIANVSGEPSETLCVPVTVEHFNNVAGVQVSVISEDTSVFKITGLTNIALNPGLFSFNVLPGGEVSNMSWFNATAINLADGAEVFCINIEITGELGDSAGLLFTNAPVPAEITVINGSPTQGPGYFINGSVVVEPDTGAIAGLEGTVVTEYGSAVSGVVMSIKNTEAATPASISDSYGDYYMQVFAGIEFELAASRETDPLEGVTTLDLVKIQQHLLQISLLDSPYKIIAADVNGDGVLSTFDLLLIQANLVGNISEFPGNSSWRFVPADYEFINPENPLGEEFPESKWYEGINGMLTQQDWIGIKVGDVNNSYNPANTAEIRDLRPEYHLLISDVEKLDENTYLVPLFFIEFDGLSGMQFSLPLESQLGKIKAISFENSELETSYGLDYLMDLKSGYLNFSWYDGRGVYVENRMRAFNLIVESKDFASYVENLAFSAEGRLVPEAYSRSGEIFDLGILSELQPPTLERIFELYQNVPNPFSSHTTIGFTVPERMEVVLEIYSEDGKLIRVIETTAEAGMNQISINDDGFTSGLYYYRLEAGEFSGVKSMIKVD